MAKKKKSAKRNQEFLAEFSAPLVDEKATKRAQGTQEDPKVPHG